MHVCTCIYQLLCVYAYMYICAFVHFVHLHAIHLHSVTLLTKSCLHMCRFSGYDSTLINVWHLCDQLLYT